MSFSFPLLSQLAWSQLLYRHAFALLAVLPGFIAMFNLIAVKLGFKTTKDSIKALLNLSSKSNPFMPETNLEEYKPSFSYTLLGALCLSAVFEVVAAFGGNGATTDLGVERLRAGAPAERLAARVSAPNAGAPAAPARTAAASTGTDAPRRAQSSSTPANTAGSQGVSEPTALDRSAVNSGDSGTKIGGLAGLVYSGYGAYVFTLILVMARLNSSALTGKFLALCSLRSAIALILGFAAGDTNLFSGLSPNQALFVLFFIGLFPSWAMEALRKKAQEVFKVGGTGCQALPLCLVDGLDDGTSDRLAEIGVWDIQHLATSNPFSLVARTLYPIRRIIDWVDQATLITYSGSDIVFFRAVGVRGAIDLSTLYKDAMGLDGGGGEDEEKEKESQGASGQTRSKAVLQERACTIFKLLAQKSSFSEDVLLSIGRIMAEDSVVNLIQDFWKYLAKSKHSTPASGAPTSPDGTAGLVSRLRRFFSGGTKP
ncbi:MAG TPA: hypothetical protein VHG32_00045 [Thermoanaerobaculia bacterium]|jgi:hypothetical protein|nr:hypothetical protein [Thermoanaerobaculia bacterium]